MITYIIIVIASLIFILCIIALFNSNFSHTHRNHLKHLDFFILFIISIGVLNWILNGQILDIIIYITTPTNEKYEQVLAIASATLEIINDIIQNIIKRN
jgi:hypothetical protein